MRQVHYLRYVYRLSVNSAQRRNVMPRIDPETNRTVRASLKKKKVFDFPMLLLLLNCSIRSGRTKLKQWQAHTSYNERGQYYALPEVPRFDTNGLWWYQGAYFSKYGTLKNTVVHLAGASPSGLNGEQIGTLVGLDPRSFLHHFRDAPGIRREKHQGVYVYFSDDEAKYSEQTAKRLEAVVLGESINDADAIVILVALIKHHGFSADHLAGLPEVRARALTVSAVDSYLKQHGLEKKTGLKAKTYHSKR